MFVLTVVLLRTQAEVPFGDTAVFFAYVALCLSLPGLLVWRWLDRRETRPFVEDVVLGTILGYVVELPAYLLCLALGIPRLGLSAPVVIVALTLATSSGRTLWRRPSTRMSTGWSWSMAALVGYCVMWVARAVWSTAPMTRDSLRSPYVDEPFHLALVGELRHHLPADMPFVDGVPLFYHWLSYAHVASSSWITGLEPVLLLRTLSMTPLFALTVVGIGVIANRLTSQLWYGVVAAALLTLVSTLDVFGWTPAAEPWAGDGFVSAYLYLSPTQTFGAMIFVPVMLLILEVLGRGGASRRTWALLAVLMLVLAGSKATFLPILVAGLIGATLLTVLISRRLPRVAAAVAAMSVMVFLVAQVVFYGGSSRSLSLSPLATTRRVAESFEFGTESGLSASTVGIVTVSFLVAQLVLAAGALGLVVRRGWRDPGTQFLFGSASASLGATLLFDHPAMSQLYFLYSGLPVLVLASALGLARLTAPVPSRHTAWFVLAGVAGGVAIAIATSGVRGRDAATPRKTAMRRSGQVSSLHS